MNAPAHIRPRPRKGPSHLARRWGVLLLLMILAACSPTAPPITPTAPPPTRTPSALTTFGPTASPRPLHTSTAPPPTRTTAPPSATPTPYNQREATLGQSADGRPIIAHRYGDGSRAILFVGGIHAGTESNAVELARLLMAHAESNPNTIHPAFTWWVVPVANPDGAATDSRFNGRGVDLNRNWGCGWSPQAVWGNSPVDAGAGPMSEPETRALAAFIEALRPEAVVFYHSAADGVFAGACPARPNGVSSAVLEAVYAEAAGYSYGAAFSAYPVTGTAPSWVDGLGIPSIDVELSSRTAPQFEQNLRAALAVQRWLLGD